jgi:carbamoyltransferase
MWTTHDPLVKLFGPARQPGDAVNQQHKDIAFAVQDACEIAMLTLSREARRLTGSSCLCLSGGVALNSKANGRIAASSLFDQVFVDPAPADDGVAVGAALLPYLERDGRLPRLSIRDSYWGRSFSDADIEVALRGCKLRYVSVAEPALVAAQLLAESKIIGWFQGRAEFGPRALGNRSILADPRAGDMPDKLNRVVKFREPWRPFAPSILAEHASDYIDLGGPLRFMSMTATVHPERRVTVPAITHVDGSTRPQTVERKDNSLYWQLIEEFRKLTGVPVVLNTSFNLQGEPIVDTPGDALRTFFSSGLDALVLGGYLVQK